MYVVDRNRTYINRSIFGWKEFQIIVGSSDPSIFRKDNLSGILTRNLPNIRPYTELHTIVIIQFTQNAHYLK